MTPEKIESMLNVALTGAEAQKSKRLIAKVEAIRRRIPRKPFGGQQADFVNCLLTDLVNECWSDQSFRVRAFAAKLATLCAEASRDPAKLPKKVRQIYDAGYTNKRGDPVKPHSGKLGNRVYVAGAFAMATGFHEGPLQQAKQWVVDNDVFAVGERHGLAFPGLESNRTREKLASD